MTNGIEQRILESRWGEAYRWTLCPAILLFFALAGAYGLCYYAITGRARYSPAGW